MGFDGDLINRHFEQPCDTVNRMQDFNPHLAVLLNAYKSMFDVGMLRPISNAFRTS